MATIRKTITVTPYHDRWIQLQLGSGNYASESEVVREAIREKIERTAEVDAIRLKLIAAEQSGFTEQTVDEIWEAARTEHKSE